MGLPPPPPEVARAGLRALRMVAAADGVIHDLERRFAAAVQAHILKTSFDFDTLEPIDAEELARAVPEPFRERIIHGCLLAALIDGEASASELAVLDSFADALGVPGDALRTAHKFRWPRSLRVERA
jgi:tellurite resistance protein